MHLPRDDAIFPSHDAIPSRPVPLIVSDATRAVCFLRWRRDDRRRCVGARPDEPGRSRLFMVAPAAAAAAATSVAVTNVVLLRLTGAAAGLHCRGVF